jgi:hypothetical protein
MKKLDSFFGGVIGGLVGLFLLCLIAEIKERWDNRVRFDLESGQIIRYEPTMDLEVGSSSLKNTYICVYSSELRGNPPYKIKGRRFFPCPYAECGSYRFIFMDGDEFEVKAIKVIGKIPDELIP